MLIYNKCYITLCSFFFFAFLVDFTSFFFFCIINIYFLSSAVWDTKLTNPKLSDSSRIYYALYCIIYVIVIPAQNVFQKRPKH